MPARRVPLALVAPDERAAELEPDEPPPYLLRAGKVEWLPTVTGPAALAGYEWFRDRLARELRLTPSAATRRLGDALSDPPPLDTHRGVQERLRRSPTPD